MKKMNPLFPALLVVATLSACGGGGGSSTPVPVPNPAPTALVITSTNMQAVASNAYSSTDLLAFQQIALAAGVVTQSTPKFSVKDFVATQIQQILH